MKEKLRFFIHELRAKNGEHEQSLLRVAFTTFFYIYLSTITAHDVTAAKLFGGVYLVISLAILLHIINYPASSERRQWLSMFADTSAVTYVMSVAQESGTIFFGIYLWVIVGNGMRYGTKFLIGAHICSVIGFFITTLVNPYWLIHTQLAEGLLLTLILIPLYVLKLQRQLANAIVHAEEASQAKSKFLSHMSHEMRTPLNGVIGTTDLLLTTSLNSDQKDLVRMLKNSSHLLHRLIENVLDLSKIESGKITIEHIDFDLHELINNTVDIFSPQAAQKGIRLTSRITPQTHFMLRGDPLHLRQVIINLLGNAVKFTDRGAVELRISTLEQNDASTTLRFEVIDTGIGIAPEVQESIFESFQQANETIARRFGGTGLGTTISKQLVTLMGGRMGMQSEPNIGSIFWFEIPFEKQPANKVEQSPVTLDTLRVLTVGMAPAEQAIVSNCLSGWGLKFKHEPSEEHFFSHLASIKKSHAKGLVILHACNTRGSSAADFAARVRKSFPPEKTTLILVATDGNVADERDFFRAGYSALLASPIDKTLLFNALHEISTPHQGVGIVSLRGYFEDGTLEKRNLDILVAEDNSTNRKIISRILEQAGHRPHLAENGEQALDMLEDRDYDLMILDLNMPIMGGLDVLKIHRALTRNKPRIPVIILTADATIESMQECKAADIDSYLTKPIDALALLDDIAKLTATAAREVAAQEATSSPMPQTNAEKTILINEGTLQQLASLGKDDSFLQSLIHGFIMETEKMLDEMQAVLSSQDYVRFKELAHTVKGSSGNIGAEALHRICCDMMDINTSDLPTSADELLRQAQECFKATKTWLTEYQGNSHRTSL